MQMPKGYNELNVNLGGHKMTILNVTESTSKSGQPMLIVNFDFDKADSQPDYFLKKYRANTKEGKKWDNNGTSYILVTDKDGNTAYGFKRFVTAVENSNPGFKAPWGDAFASSFKNKKIGGVFGEEESYYNGKTYNLHKLRYFCAYDKAMEQEIPEKKLANGQTTPSTTASTDTASFMDIPDDLDAELPFC